MALRRILSVLMMIAVSAPVFAEKTTRYQGSSGGEIQETVFEEGDSEYRYEKRLLYFDTEGYQIRDERYLLANDYNDLGVQKTIKSFFPGGGLKEVEVVFRPEKAIMAGYQGILLVYDKTGVRRRMEVNFTDDHRDKQVYAKSVSHYDAAGIISRAVYYFTPRISEITGYHRVVEQYDRNGEKVAEIIYDREGNEY